MRTMKRSQILFLTVAIGALSAIQAEQDNTESVLQEEFSYLDAELAQERDTSFPSDAASKPQREDSQALIEPSLSDVPSLIDAEEKFLTEQDFQIPIENAPLAEAADEPLFIDSFAAKSLTAFAEQTSPAEKTAPADLAPRLEKPSVSQPSSWVTFNIDFRQVFAGAPVIYMILFLLSITAFFIWFYSLRRLNQATQQTANILKLLRNQLNGNHYEEARSLCERHDDHFLCKMIGAGINSRRHGPSMMTEAMKAEGKRATVAFWQKLGLLNDIAVIAPMIGLLGTVLGMFYAFYDLNRSMESLATLFDGLGISVGTTVAGMFVAIFSLVLHALAKYRLVRLITQVENEAQNLANLIDCKAPMTQENL